MCAGLRLIFCSHIQRRFILSTCKSANTSLFPWRYITLYSLLQYMEIICFCWLSDASTLRIVTYTILENKPPLQNYIDTLCFQHFCRFLTDHPNYFVIFFVTFTPHQLTEYITQFAYSSMPWSQVSSVRPRPGICFILVSPTGVIISITRKHLSNCTCSRSR